jgi:hypothetical protein
MTDAYDLALIGNFGRNEMHHFDGTTEPVIGGPVAQSAFATSWSDKRVAVVTRMAESDLGLLEPLREAGIAVFVSLVPETTRSHIFYLSEDVENRRHELEKSAGPFSLADVSVVKARLIHLAGVNRLEYPLEFMLDLKRNGMPFTIDMQALVRAANPETGEVIYCDYPHKRQVAAMAEKVKLDVVEAELLTGTVDLERAALQFEQWGTPEIMVTGTEGALVRHEGKTYFEPFTNRNVSGRTGRGDTAFSSYLARRFDYGVADSLKFAAALCSIKMETPGPFAGTLKEVLDRMSADHQQKSIANECP